MQCMLAGDWLSWHSVLLAELEFVESRLPPSLHCLSNVLCLGLASFSLPSTPCFLRSPSLRSLGALEWRGVPPGALLPRATFLAILGWQAATQAHTWGGRLPDRHTHGVAGCQTDTRALFSCGRRCLEALSPQALRSPLRVSVCAHACVLAFGMQVLSPVLQVSLLQLAAAGEVPGEKGSREERRGEEKRGEERGAEERECTASTTTCYCCRYFQYIVLAEYQHVRSISLLFTSSLLCIPPLSRLPLPLSLLLSTTTWASLPLASPLSPLAPSAS